MVHNKNADRCDAQALFRKIFIDEVHDMLRAALASFKLEVSSRIQQSPLSSSRL